MFFLAIVFSLFGAMGYLAYGESTEVTYGGHGHGHVVHGVKSTRMFTCMSCSHSLSLPIENVV